MSALSQVPIVINIEKVYYVLHRRSSNEGAMQIEALAPGAYETGGLLKIENKVYKILRRDWVYDARCAYITLAEYPLSNPVTSLPEIRQIIGEGAVKIHELNDMQKIEESKGGDNLMHRTTSLSTRKYL